MVATDSRHRREVVNFLEARGAATLTHPGGTLLAHLVRTADTLERWGARPAVVSAGLCHATYGTDGFDAALLGLDQRGVLAALIGDTAEGLVYDYASCDRAFVYPRLCNGRTLEFRDRFSGVVSVPSDDRLRDFLELTFANELDIDPAGLADLLVPCRGFVSEAAFAEAAERIKPWRRPTS